MKQTVNFTAFRDSFEALRASRFTYEGLQALFEWLEDYENDTGEELELDVIGLCCDFTEYTSLDQFQLDYGDQYATLDDIQDETTVIEIGNGGFIVAGF